MGRRATRTARPMAAGGLADTATSRVARPHIAPISSRRSTISTQIHAALRRDIIVGDLAPRAMLSEQEFAIRFGVSRTPVREAMIKLAEEGLVEIFPQYGSFVAPIKLAEVFDSQFAREALECAVVEKAVERMDKERGSWLRQSIARQRALLQPQDRDAFFEADEDMHVLIFKIAGHPSAWRFVEGAKAQMDRVRHLAITLPRKQASIFGEHEAVADRMFAKDIRGAVEAMRKHLRGIFRTVEMLRNEKTEYFSDETSAGSVQTPNSVARQSRRYVNSSATA